MAKKTTSASKPKQQSKPNQNLKLQGELAKIAKELNEGDLKLLIEQANNIKNAQISSQLSGSKTKLSERGGVESKNTIPIKILPDEKKESFIVQVGSIRKVFTRDEFRNIVKISQGGGETKEKAVELFKWLSDIKKDFLSDNNILRDNNPRLYLLINTIKGKYKTK